METETSYDLHNANWKTRKDDGVSLSPKTQELGGDCAMCKSWSESKVWEPRVMILKGKRRWMSKLKQREQTWPFSAFLFYMGPQWIGWYPPTVVSAIFIFFFFVLFCYFFLLSPLIQMLIHSRDILTDKCRNNANKVLPTLWASFSPMSGHIKLTITD